MSKHIILLVLSCGLGVDAVVANDPATTVFIDGRLGLVDGSNAYDPETRTCGAGRYRVFTGLETVTKALQEADVLFLREGTYTRSPENLHEVHGHAVNYWEGALAIHASGTVDKCKRVSAYRGETVIIQAKPGVSAYNPDPSDESFAKSSHFYPWPAVSVIGDHLEVSGLKTYGQVVINGRHILLEGCDIGGGGPHMNQGQVVALNCDSPGGTHHVVIRNNHIHHSCWGEGRANGSAIMCYNASFIAEHNLFTENYGADITVKDTGDQQGRDVVIRYNLFGPSSVIPDGNMGTHGLNQDKDVDCIRIHHNLFIDKAVGCCVDGPPPTGGMIIEHNTFVNCTRDLYGWTKAPVRAHHNVMYHTNRQARFVDLQTDPLSKLDLDYNLYFSTVGDAFWRHNYRNVATKLDAWRDYAKCDTHSVWKDPAFIDSDGSDPEDFRRKVTQPDAPNGPIFGAYETGNEEIGRLSPQERPRR